MRFAVIFLLASAFLLSPFGITEAQPPSYRVDRLVNDRTTDTYPRITQSETSIAAVGSTVVVGWNDTGADAATCSGQGYGRSTNSGGTWTDLGFLPTGTAGGVTAASVFADPVLGSNHLGEFFFAALASEPGGVCGATGRSFIGLWRSQDDGATFQFLADASPGTAAGNLQDKEEMAIDKSPTSLFQGNIYVCWTDIDTLTFSTRIRVSRSSDGGVSFSSPTTVLQTAAAPVAAGGCAVAVAPDGKVYVAWAEGVPFAGSTGAVKLRRSNDGGATWSSPVTAATGLVAGDPSISTCTTGGFPRPALKGNIRDAPIPTMAVSANGQVNMAITQGVFDGATSSYLGEIVYTRSNDLGATWDPLVTVNSDSTNDQFQPRLTVDSDGAIAVIWYDRRHDPANLRIHVREGVSFDGGTTWHDLQVTDTDFGLPPLSPNFDPEVADCYMGDYNAIIADDNRFLLAWGDNRLDTADYPSGPATDHPEPDIRFEAQIANDIDGDGWTNLQELDFIGADFLNPCTPGGWPPDPLPAPDGNGSVGIDDVFFAASRFNASDGQSNYTARAEIASQDGTIGIDDVFGFASRFNESC